MSLNHSPKSLFQSGGHLPELDGLRGLAILLVTVYRFGSDIPRDSWGGNFLKHLLDAGEHGVELFFVLSGFLITGILSQAKLEPNFFARFYYRRTLRIFPLYFFAIFLFALVMPIWLGRGTPFDACWDQQAFLWSYTVNFQMAWKDAWCFGPLDPFWSLCIEEHFYLLWPICIFILSTRSAFRLSIGILLAATIARVGFALLFGNGVAANVLPWFRMDGLALGAAISLGLREGYFPPVPRKYLVAIIATLGLAVATLVVTERQVWTICLFVWIAFWGAILYALLLSNPSDRLPKMMRHRWLRHFGKYSYAMYVFQAPLMALMLMVPWIHSLQNSLVGTLVFIILMFMLTWIVALASWHLMEKHFLRWKNAYFSKARVVETSSKLGSSHPTRWADSNYNF